MHYIDVVIDNKSNNTDTFYTYAAPDEVCTGARVSVPFAFRKAPVDGYCVRTDVTPSVDTKKIKTIIGYDPERSLTAEMIETAVWMRRRYGVRYIDAVKMFTVQGKRVPQRARRLIDAARAQSASSAELTSDSDVCGVSASGDCRGTYETGDDRSSSASGDVCGVSASGDCRGTYETGDDRGASASGDYRSASYSCDDVVVNDPGYKLSAEQQAAAEKICGAVRGREFRAFLIKGVTNSGKTEVYMKAAAESLSMGRSVIVLLPEIALSMQVAKRFSERFGRDTVATLHSRLTTSQKLGEWMRIRSGQAKIVVGARTSVFAPLENIGAIIIDEEHESTFKSDHNPKYETIDIAYKRASAHNAVLVLGSATPGIVSYYRAKTGIYDLIEMNHRIGDSIMPELEIVDMRHEAVHGNMSVISMQLAAEMGRTLQRGEQVILFLNRRGFSTQILCPDCGYRMTCPDCGITLTYHKSIGAAMCHYCGRKFELPQVCPDCGNKFIKYVGAGTEKVEETVSSLWKDAVTARFDLDTASSPEVTEKVIKDFQEGRTDILVGTQILAKGLDFRNVGLVGIINADVSLNIPDYRSSERTYQLITQVAGRAGRAGGSSRVVIQTYDPESDVLREAAAGDYETFYESELLHRNIMNYPPYSDIISVGFISEDADQAMEMARAFRKRLLMLRDAPGDASILRPRLDERKTDGRSRAGFLIKAPLGTRPGYVREYMQMRDMLTESGSKCYIEIDVNPYSTF